MKKYRLAKDITIPAGTEVTKEPPRKSQYRTESASVLIEVTEDITAEWLMDFEEAVEQGLVEEAGDE